MLIELTPARYWTVRTGLMSRSFNRRDISRRAELKPYVKTPPTQGSMLVQIQPGTL